MDYKNIAFWIMIVLVISLSIYLIIFIKSESYQCMQEPLVYGVSKFKDTAGEFTCSCSSPSIKPFIVTKEGINQGNSLLSSGYIK